MALFDPLDRALRWLREERRLRQYEIAEAAGVTKAMLSAYETGKQKPSLETLEKLLAAMDCDLVDLQHALDVFHRHSARSRADTRPAAASEPEPPVRDEEALSEVLASLHRLLLHLHQTTARSTGSSRKRARRGGRDD